MFRWREFWSGRKWGVIVPSLWCSATSNVPSPLWKVQRGFKDKIKCEIKFLKYLTMNNDEKQIHLPSSLLRTERGVHTFPKWELLPFLQKIATDVKNEVNEKRRGGVSAFQSWVVPGKPSNIVVLGLRQLNVRLSLVDSRLFYNLVRLCECQTLCDSDNGCFSGLSNNADHQRGGNLIMKHQPKLTMVSWWPSIAVHCCFVGALWWVYSTILPVVNCVMSGCQVGLLNFDLGCETALSAFVMVVSQASWLASIILVSYNF